MQNVTPARFGKICTIDFAYGFCCTNGSGRSWLPSILEDRFFFVWPESYIFMNLKLKLVIDREAKRTERKVRCCSY